MLRLNQLNLLVSLPVLCGLALTAAAQQPLLTGQAAFTDYAQQQPGVRHKITLADLPAPNPAEAVDNGPPSSPNPRTPGPPRLPASRSPSTPAATPRRCSAARTRRETHAGHAGHLRHAAPHPLRAQRRPLPRRLAGRHHLRASRRRVPTARRRRSKSSPPVSTTPSASPSTRSARTRSGSTSATRPPSSASRITTATCTRPAPRRPSSLTSPATRSFAAAATGPATSSSPPTASTCSSSVGSGSNVDDADTHPREFHRADVLEYTPDGKFEEVYAHGIRNCVGEAINPHTHELWCSVNERDNLGNHLVPDYVTSVPEDSFFGWPWYYMGGHRDPRLQDPCANGTGPNPQLAKPLDRRRSQDCKREDISKQGPHA